MLPYSRPLQADYYILFLMVVKFSPDEGLNFTAKKLKKSKMLLILFYNDLSLSLRQVDYRIPHLFIECEDSYYLQLLGKPTRPE